MAIQRNGSGPLNKMIGEEGEGQSYPMQERDERTPVKKDTFEKRMERRQQRKFKLGKRK